MSAAEVPTGLAHLCTTLDEVAESMDALGAPYVIKDDGLAAGKGVVVTDDREAGLAHAAACLAKDGGRVVVEEFLDGPEVSLFVLSDGMTVLPLTPAQDFKRVGDDDAGPNTGGMGAYSPLDWAPQGLTEDLVRRVAQPTVDEMRRRGTPVRRRALHRPGPDGRGPRVIEFNARFGDPETQVVLARLLTPLGWLLKAGGHRTARRVRQAAVVRRPRRHRRRRRAQLPGGPTHGRPGERARRGRGRAHGIRPARRDGARRQGELVSSGGRVLSVVATGADLAQARDRAYAAVGHVELEGSHHRGDIALRASRGEVAVG